MKTQKQILQKRLYIQKRGEYWQTALSVLQEECQHPNVEKKFGANTGNYDPHTDCYWIDFKCPDCGKRWTVYEKD